MQALLDAISPHVAPFALVMARIGGIFLFAPALGSPIIPIRIKGLLITALAFIVYPTVAPMFEAPARVDLISLAPMILGETMIGLTIGLVVAIPVMSVQMGGLLMGQQMGLGLATIFNPAIDDEGDIIGQILFFLALAIFLTIGGLDLMHGALVATFQNVPLGGLGAADTPLQLLTGVVASGYELAIRVAAPVLCIIMLETISTGVLMKTVPQLNVLTFGFPVKILAAAMMLVAALPAIERTILDETVFSLDRVFLWVNGL